MGCSERGWSQAQLARELFQYPQSGSMGCSPAGRTSETQPGRSFQYPQSGSMGCSRAQYSLVAYCARAFSIPKADRWAAAPAVRDDNNHGRTLSVSPKRIDGLQRIPEPTWRKWRQVAFSIPKADRWAAAHFERKPPAATGRDLSVSPKRIDGLQRAPAGRCPCPPAAPFSIPKADRWAAAIARFERQSHCQRFQYPQSGSMGCSLVIVTALVRL